MNKKRIIALTAAMTAFGMFLTGCTNSKDNKSKADSIRSKTSEYDTIEMETESTLNIESDELPLEKQWNVEADNYIGANMQNLLNGGIVSENKDYVFLLDEYEQLYRYNKETEEMHRLNQPDFTGHIVGFMNVTKEGDVLYCFAQDAKDYEIDAEVYKIDSETGEITTFLNTREYLTDNFDDFPNQIHIDTSVDINHMLLINDTLFICMSFTPYDIYDYEAVRYYYLSIDINTMKCEAIRSGYDLAYVDFAAIDKSGDLIYGRWTEQLYKYDLKTKESVEFQKWDDIIGPMAVTPDAAYYFHSDNEYDRYDFATGQKSSGTFDLPSEDSEIRNITYYNGKFYVKCRDSNYYWINEDFTESGYLCDYFSVLSSDYCGLGYAGSYLWMVEKGNIDRISLDGNATGWEWEYNEECMKKLDKSPWK